MPKTPPSTARKKTQPPPTVRKPGTDPYAPIREAASRHQVEAARLMQAENFKEARVLLDRAIELLHSIPQQCVCYAHSEGRGERRGACNCFRQLLAWGGNALRPLCLVGTAHCCVYACRHGGSGPNKPSAGEATTLRRNRRVKAGFRCVDLLAPCKRIEV